MREVEELLRQERDSELPPTPDYRYTEAVVRRRMAGAPTAVRTKTGAGLPAVSAAGVLLFGIGTAVLYGPSPWWLLALPLAVLCLCPLLLQRRESR